MPAILALDTDDLQARRGPRRCLPGAFGQRPEAYAERGYAGWMSAENPAQSPASVPPVPVPPAWRGLVDDATALGGGVDVATAVGAYAAARNARGGALVGSLSVLDTDLPLVRDLGDAPVHVVLSGGAGQVAGPAALALRSGLTLSGIELQLRDVDDLAGNVRRVVAAVDAARADGSLDDEVPVHVEIPVDDPSSPRLTSGWLRAADEAAQAELRLTFRTGGSHADRYCTDASLAAWIDAALDRETPFRVVGATARPVTHRVETEDGTGIAYGLGNLLLATRRAFDGADAGVVRDTLAEQDPARVAEWLLAEEYLAATRRWFTSAAPLPARAGGAWASEQAFDGLDAMGLLTP